MTPSKPHETGEAQSIVMAIPRLDFWYEFASTYSYLAAMRIEAAAADAGVEIGWRPFLLGPIFAAQGWSTSPFNIYPAKGRNMWRDMERQCEKRGLGLVRPETFPQNGLQAARLALIGNDDGWCPEFSRRVYVAEFGDGRNIADVDVLTEILREIGLDADAIWARAQSPENKARLKVETEAAIALGIYGAPSFVTADGELFWGNDRLEDALDWAKAKSA